MEAQKQNIKRTLVVNLTTMVASLAIALLLGELIVRMVSPVPVSNVADDPYLKYRSVNDDEYDSNNWRNASALVNADIVAFGDSMTQGQGAQREEAWPQVLSVMATTTVYQMAMGGYGPVQYTHLAKEALVLKPRIIIVGFYFGNDLYDAYDAAYHLDAWKELRDPNYASPEKPLVDADIRLSVLAGAPKGSLKYYLFISRLWVRDHVRLYALLGNATRAIREKAGLAKSQAEKAADLTQVDPDTVYVYDKDPRVTTVLSPIYRFDAVDLENPSTKEGWRISQERFVALQKLLGTSIHLVIAEIPTKEAVYLELMQKVEGKIPPAFDVYFKKENELHDELFDFCRKNKLDCMTMRPDLVSALEAGQTIYKPLMDGHPPKEGYERYAKSIYQYLAEKKLLPNTVTP